jgi:ABC-type antimicrobial peptide transport system permease subunit
VLAVDATEVPATVVGRIERLPTASDPTMTGVIVGNIDPLLGWLNAQPPWTFPDVLPAVTEPQELWLASADPDVAAAQVVSQAGDDATVLTVSATATSFSSRPVQIGLVSILFVGAAASVVLTLAGVIGYVVIAVRRRAKEMGVLRALGFRQRGVTGTFAVEQLVVLGVGAVIGVAGGVLLMRLVLPFVQLGESAEEIDPPALLVVDPTILGAYLAGLGLLLIASVAWASRRVSARDLSEVLREVER